MEEPGQLLVGLVMLAGLVSISEEILFRGVLFAALRRSKGPVSAVLLSALFFGFCHTTEVVLPTLMANSAETGLSMTPRSLSRLQENLFGEGLARTQISRIRSRQMSRTEGQHPTRPVRTWSRRDCAPGLLSRTNSL